MLNPLDDFKPLTELQRAIIAKALKDLEEFGMEDRKQLHERINKIIARGDTRFKKSLTQAEIVRACKASPDLIVLSDVFGNYAVGLEGSAFVPTNPSLNLKHVVSEHAGDWVLVPRYGSGITYRGDFENGHHVAVPHADAFYQVADLWLECAIAEALCMEIVRL